MSSKHEASLLADLTRDVGYALWQLQAFENTAAQIIVVRLRETRGVGDRVGQAITAKVEKQTLGQLVAELKKASLIQPDLAEKCEALLEERNWLVHRSRHESHGVLHDPARYTQLQERLARIGDQSLELMKQIAVLIEEHVVAAGVSREIIDRDAARLAAHWVV